MERAPRAARGLGPWAIRGNSARLAVGIANKFFATTLRRNPCPHLALASGGKAHDPRTRFANGPAQRDDPIEDGAPERSTEVASPFAPIETRPAHRTPAAFEGVDVDAGFGEKPPAVCRHAQRFAATGEQPALHEPVEHPDRQIACKMVIAGARLAQFGIARTGADAGVAGAGGQRNEPLKRARDLRIGEAEIAVPPLAFDRDKSGIFELGEMPAG